MEGDNSGTIGALLSRWHITALLERSILAPDFVMGPEWISGIRLTTDGARVVDQMLALEPLLPEPAAVFACFLNRDASLVVPEFDEAALLAAISMNMDRELLFFPNVIGRALHDEIGRQFPSSLDSLSNEQAVAVLRCIPQGVMQSGSISVGPLGAMRVRPSRSVVIGHFIPGCLCSKSECFDLHPLRLETHPQADINEALGLLDQAMKQVKVPRRQPAVLDALRAEFRGSRGTSHALIDLLSDGLTAEELRVVALSAYEECRSTVRQELRAAMKLTSESTEGFLESLSKEGLIQFLLQVEDGDIRRAVEDSVYSGALRLSDSETRRAFVLGRWGRRTTHDAELSRLGLRVRSQRESPALSMMKMVHHLYFTGEVARPQDLAFLLDKPSNSDVDDLLNTALRLGDTRSVVANVLLHDRDCATAVADQLGIFGHDDVARSELVDRVAWQLGEPNRLQFDGLDRVASFSDLLEDSLHGQRTEELVLGHVANLFKELERSLRRALTFTAWALSTDHEHATQGFVYDPELDSSILEFIEQNTDTQDSYRLRTTGKNNFAPLAAGFSRLAGALTAVQTMASSDAHPPSGLHERPRVFVRGPAFLSLTDSAQRTVLSSLTQMSELLGNSIVARVRNATIHPDNPFPTPAEFREALQHINAWVGLAQTSGFYPTISTLVFKQLDGMGREERRYTSGAGEEKLFIPQWHDTGRMPNGGDQLLFLPAASLGSVGALRFQVASSALDEAWRGYPRRATAPGDLE